MVPLIIEMSAFLRSAILDEKVLFSELVEKSAYITDWHFFAGHELGEFIEVNRRLREIDNGDIVESGVEH